MAGACSMHGEMRHAYKSLDGKPKGIKPLGRPRCRCKHNITLDLKKTVGVALNTDWTIQLLIQKWEEKCTVNYRTS
jgi:hypothetical protein